MNETKKRTREELIELWRIAESKLAHLLNLLSNRFSDAEKMHIKQYLDANEYGIAFEELVLTIQKHKKPLTSAELTELQSVYDYFRDGLIEVNNQTMEDIAKFANEVSPEIGQSMQER